MYVYTAGLRNIYCPNKKYYQPFPVWSNGSSQCSSLKSKCNGEGQMVSDMRSTSEDAVCRCDYTIGYGFVTTPKRKCFCIPLEEDCSCYIVKCPGNSRLTQGKIYIIILVILF